MKQNQTLFAALALAGGAFYYFFFYKKPSALKAATSPAGTANFVPTGPRPTVPVNGAAPSLNSQLAQAGVNTASNLLQTALGALLGKGGGSGGGGSRGGGGGGFGAAPGPSASRSTPTYNPVGTTFGSGVTGVTTTNAAGDTLVQTNADFGDLLGDPTAGSSDNSKLDAGIPLDSGSQDTIQSVDLPSADIPADNFDAGDQSNWDFTGANLVDAGFSDSGGF